MSKKKLVIIFSVIILISIPSLLYAEYRYKLNISQTLFKNYLNSYKSDSKNENERLLDYKIKVLGMTKLMSSNFTFTVEFSVKPVRLRKTNYWVAGNGELESDGWIKNKFTEVTVNKKNGKYVIVNMGND